MADGGTATNVQNAIMSTTGTHSRNIAITAEQRWTREITMRLIDADALIEDLEYDVELDARALDDTDLLLGMDRELVQFDKDCKQNAIDMLKRTPTMETDSTLREKALLLLVTWAEECGFGYNNFPEEYETYKDEIEGMGYIDGMIYIAERVVENETD